MKNIIHLTYALIILIFISSCNNETSYTEVDDISTEYNFVGKKSCIECHAQEYKDWRHSDHDKAMAEATDASVVGDFNNSTYTDSDGFVSKFYKKDDKFFVYTKGENGEAKEMKVEYTFGVRPLQQYLIPTTKGRLQCLPIAWDVQTDSWYSLVDSVYHGQKISPDNWLYWTNNGQNWNGMCAECHSTNLHKGYNPDTKEFNTTWSEINVSCEACHGPASRHVEWANIDSLKRPELKHFGLKNETHLGRDGIIDQCAYCHARRTSFGDNKHEGDNMLNHMFPHLINNEYYHSDGQILEEDYVYTSFAQTKMYQNHVKCTDCHNAHSLKTKKKGDALCYQCHEPELYEEKHHFHKSVGGKGKMTENGFYENERGDGTQCVDCHMTGAKFMGVDYRRDHSFRIPRPDLSIKNGTPNACNQCHKEKSNEWSVEWIEKWYGKKGYPDHEYLQTFADAREGKVSSVDGLKLLLKQEYLNPMLKATAIEYLATFNNNLINNEIKDLINDKDPLVRHSAISNFSTNNVEEFISAIYPSLHDSIKAVRIIAIRKLLDAPKEALPKKDEAYFNKIVDEYIETMKYSLDFAESAHNLGSVYDKLGDKKTAIKYYKDALLIDNQFYPSAVSLAISYSQQGNNKEAKATLNNILKNQNELSIVYYYLGLIYNEEGNTKLAIKNLKNTIKYNPIHSRAYYNLGLIYLNKKEIRLAESNFVKTIEIEDCNYQYLQNLGMFYLNQLKVKKANKIADKLIECFPNEPIGKEMKKAVEGRISRSK
ncbi:MAG: tetratricopeptide repeat protein [Ichthyobacteriaceae bacterium]|nr:tetratricopeptide repeat protein [Ichthyobacteriaceae bacterium]